MVKNTPQCTWHGDTLHLAGDWELAHHGVLDAQLKNAQRSNVGNLSFDGSKLGTLDTAGCLLLKYFAERCGASLKNVALISFKSDYEAFIQEIWFRDIHLPESKKQNLTMLGRFMARVGERFSTTLSESANMLSFTGHIVVACGRIVTQPKEFRFGALVRHMDEAGVRAIPIVCLLAFLISIVLAYQGATQLKMFGADIFTIDLTAISILREMGVLLTAIMVAGRSGSAYAAEIGVMKLREEVDALKTIGLDPFQILVLPRVLALVIMLPVLTFIADIAGLAGTFLMTSLLMDISFDQFMDRCDNVIALNTFMVGIAKAPIFGFLIALVGTYQGMQVNGSAESVGRLTTISVVQSIFFVIFADALFSILFSTFGL